MTYHCKECGNRCKITPVFLLSVANGVSICPYCGHRDLWPQPRAWQWLISRPMMLVWAIVILWAIGLVGIWIIDAVAVHPAP